ncbi:MAG: anaerobic ribonucleoside-triphosphate reductase activating protein [Deltaproteobacteria bacterium]|nr:MAG: anaerobic ribonucleoside-triphosphate reductase activating protein [Deltaproteobacteria bacterium]
MERGRMRHLPPAGGFAPFSSIDWPGRLSAVVFLRGCPWRCPYCHNEDLQKVRGPTVDWDEILQKLEQRRGFLDGVVFSGGEPTMHPSLADAMRLVREMGYATALHTGGAFPEIFGEILAEGLVDWVGFDVKAPFGLYEKITGRRGSGKAALRSFNLLRDSGVDYELRTTVYGPVLNEDTMLELARQLGKAAEGRFVLQQCRHPSSGIGGLDTLASRVGPLVGAVGVR